MGVKIVIQSHANSFLGTCPIENASIIRFLHIDLGNVDRLEPSLAKQGRCARRQPLVEQQTHQAT